MVSSYYKVALVMLLAVMMLAGQVSEAAPGTSVFGLTFPTFSRKTMHEALAWLRPHKVPCCWHGYDANGYSRNGRDVSNQQPDFDHIPPM